MQTALSPEEIAHLSAQLAVADPNIPQGEADDIQPARIEEAVALFRDLVFPGFFTARPTLECLSQLSRILYRQIEAARCVVGETCCAKALTQQFMQAIPALRNTLGLDVRAIYNGDPAAASHTEVILCYPSVRRSCITAWRTCCIARGCRLFRALSANWRMRAPESTSTRAQKSAPSLPSTTARAW